MKSKFLEKYQIYLYSLKIKIPANYWFLAIIIASLLLGVIGFLINIKVGILLFVIILDLGIGIPIYKYLNHIKNIERYWPDALKLIADTMKAGSSFDFALREVATSDYGDLSEEINGVIRRLEMGDNLHVALTYLTIRVDSKIIKRTVTLIQESLRTGAQLAEVLEEIANDTKYLFRVKKERLTKTMLQTIFIVAAAGVIAPFIFGLTRVITQFLSQVAIDSGIAAAGALEIAIKAQSSIYLLLDIYIVIMTLAASAMIAMMREGKLTNVTIYFPALLTIAYIVYAISQFILTTMLSGMI
ncbi:MAG: type II secretion system F family protein [archaeon]|jgi:archaellum biogenesis protein FlaJ (TadC family)|nr:type II secretion system F family protein [archaeon]MDD2477793.1 type II secretion system F family protein [Candidatus ainarchaeum sp.]MDD3084890.1 type II secretion system F family protein [Candidatus ainarchaeum sp.]MDD4221169.1 type II secretion system F family protein [Candidatus ainarchaeum sp.]MDD4662879.1 type II secretion system F family protein [Candidatus ainarchaeum sp.]